MAFKKGCFRQNAARKTLPHHKSERKEKRQLYDARDFELSELISQAKRPTKREWVAALEELAVERRARVAAEVRVEGAEARVARLDHRLSNLKRSLSRRTIELWPAGSAKPRSALMRMQRLKEAMEQAAAKLELTLTSPAVANSVKKWICKTRDEESQWGDKDFTGDEAKLRLHNQVMEFRSMMDGNAVADSLAMKILMRLKLKGLTGDAMTLARQSLDDVMQDDFSLHSNDMCTWVGPKELVGKALIFAGVKFEVGAEPDFVIVGDGRTAGKKTTTFLAIRLIRVDANEKAMPGTKHAIFPLAIMNHGEKREELAESLEELNEELADLQENGCEINGVLVKPRLWLGGDMKWLLVVTGCNTAPNACMHCHVTRKERKAWHVRWPLQRTDNDTKKQGRLHENLFPFIPVERVIPDFLHLHLRIGERLIHLVAAKLLSEARVVASASDQEQTRQGQWLAAQMGPEIERLAKVEKGSVRFELRERCWQVCPKLTGDRLRPVLAKMDFGKVPFLAQGIAAAKDGLAARFQECWGLFVKLFEIVNCPHPFSKDRLGDEFGPEQWQKYVDLWVKFSCHENKALGWAALFPAQDFMTPYVHTMLNHVTQLLLLHGDMHELAGQEFEKENNFHNLLWFRCSSRRGDAATRGIMLAALRKLFNTYGDDRHFLCPDITCTRKFKGLATLYNHLEHVHHRLPTALDIESIKRAQGILEQQQRRESAVGEEVACGSQCHAIYATGRAPAQQAPPRGRGRGQGSSRALKLV